MPARRSPPARAVRRSPHARPRLSHVDAAGAMRMVDVGAKPTTHRVAVAEAFVRIGSRTRELLTKGSAAKGDVLAAVRVAGIQAAKRTWELIPLCHPIALTHTAVEAALERQGVRITTRAETSAPTGVEMEALTAAAVAALTLYDMLKATERGITIEAVRLIEKSGGRSGIWRRQGG